MMELTFRILLTRSLPEELADQLFLCHVQVVSYVAQDFCECANAKLFVGWDCDVVCAALQI